MNIAEMAEGALKIVRTCVAVRPGETVLILTDLGVSPKVAQALTFAGSAAGGTVVTVTMPRPQRPGEEPPALVAEAMRRAQVILAPTSLSVYHTEAGRQACAGGARMLAISECREETLVRGGIEADFRARAPVAEALAGRLTGDRLELRTPGGTHLTMSLGRRPGVANTAICDRPGLRGGMPTIEGYIAPLEGTAEGVAVIDASLAILGLITTPITIRFSRGRAESFEGGSQAQALEEIVTGTGDANAFMLSELGIGLNPRAGVVGRIIEDEGAYGTCHIALGSNVHFGGRLAAPLHLDMVMWTPSITVDGQVLMQNGKLNEEGR